MRKTFAQQLDCQHAAEGGQDRSRAAGKLGPAEDDCGYDSKLVKLAVIGID